MNEKPSLLERLGSALNSSDLSPVDGKMQSVELIAALAYTQINPDASAHVELDAALIDPRTELASILVRLKYGGDRVLGDRAVHLLVSWVVHQKAYAKWKVRREGPLYLFARQGLAEWLYAVCPVCSGRKLLGMDKGEIVERRIKCTGCRGQGDVVRDGIRKTCLRCGGNRWTTHRRVKQTKPSQCYSCRGTGQRRPSDAERALALRVDHKVYERHWARRFSWLAAGLDRLDHLQKLCLQSQFRMP
jgi:hypothetical protein